LDCIPGTVCNSGAGDTMGSEICQPGEYCTADGKKYTDKGFYTFNKASISQIPCPIGTF
jgi:hypothetical protein